MDEKKEDQNIIYVKREHLPDFPIDAKENKTEEKIETINEQKNESTELKNSAIEIEPISSVDPFDQLKLIRKKIENENTRIKEINNQLDKISISNYRLFKKKNMRYNDDFDSIKKNKIVTHYFQTYHHLHRKK